MNRSRDEAALAVVSTADRSPVVIHVPADLETFLEMPDASLADLPSLLDKAAKLAGLHRHPFICQDITLALTELAAGRRVESAARGFRRAVARRDAAGPHHCSAS